MPQLPDYCGASIVSGATADGPLSTAFSYELQRKAHAAKLILETGVGSLHIASLKSITEKKHDNSAVRELKVPLHRHPLSQQHGTPNTSEFSHKQLCRLRHYMVLAPKQFSHAGDTYLKLLGRIS